MNLLQFALAVISTFVMPLALAQDLAPDALIKSIADDVMAALRQDQDAKLVEARILPHFDFRRSTQIAVGANWRRATAGQQEQLTREFRTLLVRTYSGVLASYRDQVIEFKPLRLRPGDTEVTVRSHVKQASAEPVVIEYDLERTALAWQVFDVRVGGISLVATYRSAFAEEVRNHGIEGLIGLLSSKNRGTVKRVSV